MNKWGVRLVGWYFIIRAILTAVGLILSPTHAGGFFGIYMDNSISFNLPIGNCTFPQIDFMALWETFFLFLVGYYILRFQSRARLTALIVLWPSTIYYGFYFILMTLAAIFSFFDPEAEASATLRFFKWSRDVNDPLILLLAFTGFFLFYSIPTYLLMRKDVKHLFEKPAAVDGAISITQGEKL